MNSPTNGTNVAKMADVIACVVRKERTISELVEVTQTSKAAISRYLHALEQEGLVESKAERVAGKSGKSYVWRWTE